MTWQTAALHTDREYMKNTRYGERIMSGAILFAIAMGLEGTSDLRPVLKTYGIIDVAQLGVDSIQFTAPVYRGDSFLYPSIARMLIDDYLLQTAGETDPHERLTDREREVLKLVAEGHTNRQIADLLVLSVKTILGHRTRIMGKLDIHNRTELVKYAIRKGLINVDD